MGIGTDVYNTVSELAASYYTTFFNYLPNVITGLLIIIIGYFAAKLSGWLVRKILYRFNLDKKLRKADLDDSFGRVSLARLFGTLAQWFVFFVFFAKSLTFLSVGSLTLVADQLARWTFIATGSIILIVIGFVFIDFVLYKVWEIRTRYDKPIQVSARLLIIAVVTFTTLDQQGVNISFLKNMFLLVFAALLLSASLAVGIGVGISIAGNVGGTFKKIKKRR